MDPCYNSVSIKPVLVGKSSLEVVDWPSPKVQFPSDWKRKSPHSWHATWLVRLCPGVVTWYGFQTTGTFQREVGNHIQFTSTVNYHIWPNHTSHQQFSSAISWGIQWIWTYDAYVYARSNSSQTTSFECSVASCLPRSSMPKAIEHYAAKHFL